LTVPVVCHTELPHVLASEDMERQGPAVWRSAPSHARRRGARLVPTGREPRRPRAAP
jgi:hypothetical protein